jgi:hypothetical protein
MREDERFLIATHTTLFATFFDMLPEFGLIKKKTLSSGSKNRTNPVEEKEKKWVKNYS